MIQLSTYHESKIPLAQMAVDSSGAGKDSEQIAKLVRGFRQEYANIEQPTELAEKLFDARANCKKLVNEIAMPMLHMSRELRDRFFIQIDTLLDLDDWDEHDRPVTSASMLTFIRMLVLLNPRRRPGLGATSSGDILAVWAKGENRLTIECLPADRVRWVVFGYFDDKRETAAGENDATRLANILKPYQPEQWFDDERSTAAS